MGGSRAKRKPRSIGGALALTVVGVLLPSIPLRAGGRRRLALAVEMFQVLAVIVGLGWFLTRDQSDLLALALQPSFLAAVVVAALLLLVVWPLLLVLGWRAVRPPGLRGAAHLLSSVVVIGLCLLIMVPLGLTASYAGVQRDLVSTVFPSGIFDSSVSAQDREGPPSPDPWRGRGRVNVLLLGGDAGPDRQGLRTDTVILASTDVRTGATTLFSLPRNLENLPFPPGELSRAYPEGFPDLLNAVYPNVNDRGDLLVGARDPGAQALKLGVSEALGLTVDYYVLVDFEGFRALVDALGGVTVNVKQRLSYGAIKEDGSLGRPTGFIEAGVQTMNGETALTYARSRDEGSDYERIERQRCVIDAFIEQADPLRLLVNYTRLAAATKQHVSTDIPQDLLPDFVELGNKVKEADVRSVAFVPPLIHPGYPDYALMKQLVSEELAAAEASAAAGDEGAQASSAPTNAAPATPAPPPPDAPPEATRQPIADLAAVC